MSGLVQEERLLRLLASELHERPMEQQEREVLFGAMTGKDWSDIMGLAVQNRVCPLLLGAVMRNRELPVPMQVGRYLEQVAFQNSMSFYQKMSLVCALLEELKQQKAEACVLKGVTLSALFPTPESRTFSDIDVFIPDGEAFRRVVSAFEAAGYEKKRDDMTDHHESFFFASQGIQCDVELHYRLNTTWGNTRLDTTLDRIYREALAQEPMGRISVMNVEIPTLPSTLEALYLLMHLFQHFTNKGFGIRLFLDWVSFWRKKREQVDEKRLSEWIQQLGLTYFADAVDGICVQKLGMELPDFGYLTGRRQEELERELLEDVFAGGDFGHQDRNRMVVTSGKSGVKAYLMELHRQTMRHYPRASQKKLLLPLLWLWTAAVFQYNNIFRRKISLKAVISSTNQRTNLAHKFHIFDES